MARSLSTILFKGLTRLSSTRISAPVCGSFYQNGIKYSTTLSDDPPDTHKDFRPASKLEDPSLSVRDIVEQDVKENPVMIYMKGIPELPRCGFSSLAVRVLKEYNVPLSARNILEDPELKNAVKAFSNWPTFPQIFINGEFVGGSDIILSMHQNGELEEKLKDMVSSKGNSAS
ncbi:Monothiol glutaredoxin-S15, mitochondrial [Dionaea muscipula]